MKRGIRHWVKNRKRMGLGLAGLCLLGLSIWVLVVGATASGQSMPGMGNMGGMGGEARFVPAQREMEVTSGPFVVRIHFDRPPTAGPLEVTVELRPAKAGQSLAQAGLEVTAVGVNRIMPFMHMASDHEVVELQRLGEGLFAGKVRFMMGGDWLLNVLVDTPQGQSMTFLTFYLPWE